MKVELEPGKYVVAVSGGVDSIVLLDLLFKDPNLELIVAHFDHGIREDSEQDRKLVENIAEEHNLEFEYSEGRLGAQASEDHARRARYQFLNDVLKKHGAKAVVTAHHQDDLLETALINLLRGTGRKGLTSLGSNDKLVRPLLDFGKSELVAYAKAQQLTWREDSTNKDTDYLRNYVRLKIVPKLTEAEKSKLTATISNLQKTNKELDKEIANYLQSSDKQTHKLDRKLIINLSHEMACEVMAEWLRSNNIREFDRKTIQRLVVASKTFKSGQRADINNKNYLLVDSNNLEICSSNQ